MASIVLGAFYMPPCNLHYKLVRNYYTLHFTHRQSEALRVELINDHTTGKGYSWDSNHVLTAPESVSFSLCYAASL